MDALLAPAWNVAAPAATRPSAARRAVQTLFFLNGALIATWASRIPAVQEQRGLGHGALGLALLAVAAGAVVAMPLTGWLIARCGSDRLAKFSALLFCAALPAILLSPNTALFIVALFSFGASHGALDVAMNAQAVAVEKRYGRSIMSSFHAFWSTGGLAGASLGGLLAARGLPPLVHFGLAAALCGIAALFLFPSLLRAAEPAEKAPSPRPGFFLPTRSLVALGALALCVMVGEGAMADWGAVYLRHSLGATEGLAAAGYAVFSIAMAGARFSGDFLSTRFGPVALVRASGLLAATGLATALLSAHPALALAGFACVGAGFSTVVPLVFTAAGRQPDIAPGAAVASVTTLGFLLGPPVIGFAAELIGLRGALAGIVATSLLTALLATNVRPLAR